MSLVMLLAVEFGGWIAFNRITPFSVPRLTVALRTVSGGALFGAAYLSLWEVSGQVPFIDLLPILEFTIINTLIALGIGLIKLTRSVSNV